MASDEISVRLDEIVESLNQVLNVTEDLPESSDVSRVVGPRTSVTRDFSNRLTSVALLARAAAVNNKSQIRRLADVVVITVKELEAADQISGAHAKELDEKLAVPEPAPAITSTHYTPGASPTKPTVPVTSVDWA